MTWKSITYEMHYKDAQFQFAPENSAEMSRYMKAENNCSRSLLFATLVDSVATHFVFQDSRKS